MTRLAKHRRLAKLQHEYYHHRRLMLPAMRSVVLGYREKNAYPTNMYFIAGFYPEDELIRTSPFMKSFNQKHFALLFGGKTMRQCVVDDLPMELRRLDKAEARYDRFIMNYRDELYEMRMPLGELNEETGDPDDASIV